ncbi:Vegetative incompatibility protein HET-E-1-like protein 16 [Colletotrichum chlorophyti]|uniref:Vegetative incompatibility protein HET-E-1-like protein 16 n=1 Tax=Colletotrichum chlorophyti TaxID=708187 RepID=A0A1Q8S272_9PEZI|nr:Vegetative incompatibility protein HET-E-1-like protein 16 [Colletotrichum chlorophyti]
MTSTGARVVPQNEYTIGWVCALPCERAAAKAMLDEIHQNLVEQDPADHNSYTLGQIQNHNVVIACLPAGVYGIAPAATVAKDMLRTFKSIRFGLMVGIGGGVPTLVNDIRLGDVVVSQPLGTSGGVVQYDRGKTVQEGEVQRTGSLNAPPSVLLTALTDLQAEHLMGGSRIPHFLSEIIIKYPKMEKRFSYQGTSEDRLFRVEYDHADPDSTCEQCDGAQTIERTARDDTEPAIHYGVIASGNQVIKNGSTRNQLSKQLGGALCFEMEAAGLIQDFPCIVIRGICDYADSHKNKRWQEYAAVTAAAFAKELLSIVSPVRVLQEKPIPQLVSDPQLHKLMTGTNAAIAEQTRKHEVRYEDKIHGDCHRAFKTSNYEKFKNINPGRTLGTCKWVLGHQQYNRWQQSRCDDLLWISADPGCGKSVLSKFLIDEELRSPKAHTVCYFFFKDNEEQDSIATALCAVLHQLFHYQPQLLRHAMEAYKRNGENLNTEVDELWRILLAAATDEHAESVICVLDALDECQGGDRRKLIAFLTGFYTRRSTKSQRRSHLKFLVTSRPYQEIENSFSDIPSELPSIRLAGEESNADISQEIDLVIAEQVSRVGRKLNLNQEIQDMLHEKLLATSHRTYLWLYLVIEELYCSDKRTMKAYARNIASLPQSVENAYEKILSRHSRGRRHEAETLLHIVVGSRRPLTLAEMDVALQLATDSADARIHEDLDLDNDHLASRIRELCGLFVFINDSRVYLIHQTAKDFLVSWDHVDDSTIDICKPWKHSLENYRTAILLTQICVRYLGFQDIDDKSLSSVVEKVQSDSSGCVIFSEYPFLEYAAVHWSAHFRSMRVCDTELFNHIYQLYDDREPRYETWVSIFWKATFGDKYLRLPDTMDLAALNGHASVLSHLLDATKVDINVQNGLRRTGVSCASPEVHEKVVHLLIKKGAMITANLLELKDMLTEVNFQR